MPPTMGMARLPSGSTRMYRLMQIRGIQPPLPGTRWMPMAGGRDDVMETEVTLPGLSLAELAAYMGTPETLTYVQEAEGRNEWKITDGETIAACLKALEQMKVGEKTDLRAADAGDTLLFTMADGSTWTLDFENGNLVRNGSCYATEAGRPFGRY